MMQVMFDCFLGLFALFAFPSSDSKRRNELHFLTSYSYSYYNCSPRAHTKTSSQITNFSQILASLLCGLLSVHFLCLPQPPPLPPQPPQPSTTTCHSPLFIASFTLIYSICVNFFLSFFVTFNWLSALLILKIILNFHFVDFGSHVATPS